MKENPSNEEIFYFLDITRPIQNEAILIEMLEHNYGIPDYVAKEVINAWRSNRQEDLDNYAIEVIHLLDGEVIHSMGVVGFADLKLEFRERFKEYHHPAFKVIIWQLS